MKIYPAIDLMNGRVVRLSQGDFSKSTDYGLDPAEVAKKFLDAGATHLHVVDLDGARSGNRQLSSLVKISEATTLRVQTGGGVKTKDDVRGLTNLGVDRVIVGSLAVNDTEKTVGWISEFGDEKFTLAFDVKRDEVDGLYKVQTAGWLNSSGLALENAVDMYAGWKNLQFLVTDIGRDGMLGGPNFELYKRLLARFPDLNILLSGGVKDEQDLVRAKELGLYGAVIGKSIYEGKVDLTSIFNI